MAYVVTDERQRGVVTGALRNMACRDRLSQFHFADEGVAGRVALAKRIADLELMGSVVVSQTSAHTKLEQWRSRLLVGAAASLQQYEGISRLIIESRNQADKNDRKALDVARAQRRVRGDFHVNFARKSEDPLLWVADVVASAFTVVEKGGDPEPWQALNEGQLIEVRRF